MYGPSAKAGAAKVGDVQEGNEDDGMAVVHGASEHLKERCCGTRGDDREVVSARAVGEPQRRATTPTTTSGTHRYCDAFKLGYEGDERRRYTSER